MRMVRRTLTVASIGVIVSACGVMAKPTPHSASAAQASQKKPHAVKTAALPPSGLDDEDEAVPTKPSRQIGDYHVYQYSGSFSKQPLTLTEQVVGKDGDAILVDFVLEEGQKMTALRVRMRDDGEVLAVRRVT